MPLRVSSLSCHESGTSHLAHRCATHVHLIAPLLACLIESSKDDSDSVDVGVLLEVFTHTGYWVAGLREV